MMLQSWTQSQKNLCTKVAKKQNVSTKKVYFVINERREPITQLPKEEAFKQLQIIIAHHAQQCGALKTITNEMMKESIRFVYKKFPEFSLNEIVEVFLSWASEELKIKNAEMFHGNFNVRFFGQILAAYKRERNSICSQYRYELSESAMIEKRETKREQIKRIYQQAKEFCTNKDKYQSWKDIPRNFANQYHECKLLYVSKKDMQEAKIHAEKELIENNSTKSLRTLQISIARQLAFYEKVVCNPDFTVQNERRTNYS